MYIFIITYKYDNNNMLNAFLKITFIAFPNVDFSFVIKTILVIPFTLGLSASNVFTSFYLHNSHRIAPVSNLFDRRIISTIFGCKYNMVFAISLRMC